MLSGIKDDATWMKGRPVPADQVTQPGIGGLRRPPLRRVVDVDEAEPLGLALRPLEVVQ